MSILNVVIYYCGCKVLAIFIDADTMIYKTTEYLRMKGVLDSIELRMLRRADYMRECNILRESHVHRYETQSVGVNGWELGEQIVCSP